MELKVTRVNLTGDLDIVLARQRARENARALGFGLTDQTRFATAVSEVARQALAYQENGSISFAMVRAGARQGLECTCFGCAPPQDASAAMQEAFDGAKRLVDSFAVQPIDGGEIVIVMRQWLPYRGTIRE